jgi:hypothetical protein
MEGGGRCLPEEGLVITGEAAEMPEPILGGDFRYCRYVGGAVAQSSLCEMHPAQPQISLGAHPKLLWQHTSNVRSDTPIALESSGM